MSEKKKSKSSKSQWVFRQTENIENFYTIGEPLGQPGQFGIAYRVTDIETKKDYACKIISKARFSRVSSSKMQRYHFEQLRAEIRVMQKMDHDNIIKLIEVFESKSKLYIVMESCTGGELFDRIKDQGSYSEKSAARVLAQMCAGLKYMHENKIAHCDLKPDNFLFLNKKEDSPVKIIDFGMSKFVKRRKYFKSICGTPYYVAPEVIKGKYTECCDMWSLGVVMFVMLFGYPPFYADPAKYGDFHDDRIFQLVQKGFKNVVKDGFGAHFPSSIPCSDAAKDLIVKLLDLDPIKRLTAGEALEHPWLTGLKASDKPMVIDVLKNLRAFRGNLQIKHALLGVMTDMMSEQDINELKTTFEEIDVNGDGTITIAELEAAFDTSTAIGGLKRDQIRKMVEEADVDGDGALSYEELLMTSIQRKVAAKEERLWNTFCKLDLDGDGTVDQSEIEKIVGDNDRAINLIATVDQDGDGKINYDEFMNMWFADDTAGKKRAKK